MTGGRDLTAITHETRTLSPQAIITIPEVTLDENSYAEGHDDYMGKTIVCRWWLLPESVYSVHFGFLNEASESNGNKIWVGNAISGALRIKVTKPSVEGLQIEGGFSIPKDNYFIGEPIYVTFQVVNRGDKSVRFQTGGDYAENGRHDRFSFLAKGASGKEVEDPIRLSEMGGCGGDLGGDEDIAPGKAYSETLLLNAHCAFREAGQYTVVGKRTLNLCPEHGEVDIGVFIEIAKGVDPTARRLALAKLTDWESAECEELLCKALHSADKEERRAAVQLCYRHPLPRGFNVLNDLTGRQFREEYSDWHDWWEKETKPR